MNWSLDLDVVRQLNWDALAARPARSRVAILLGLAVFAALLPGLLGTWWLADEWATQTGQERSLRAQIALQTTAAASLPAVRQQQAQLNETLGTLDPLLVEAADVPALWLHVQARAQAQALQLAVFEPGAPVAQTDYTVLPATLRVRGTYPQLARFMAALAHDMPAVNLRRWTLLPAPDGRLNADIDLVAYQRRGEGPGAASRPVARPPPGLSPAWVQTLAQLADPFAAPPVAQASHPPEPFQLASLRPPGPLQGLPLKDIALVGTLAQDGQILALLRAGDRVYPAGVGDTLGQNHGEVLRIDAGALVLREWIRQPNGAWASRELRLALAGQAP